MSFTTVYGFTYNSDALEPDYSDIVIYDRISDEIKIIQK